MMTYEQRMNQPLDYKGNPLNISFVLLRLLFITAHEGYSWFSGTLEYR
jgi:hypothetical protein